MYEIERKFLLKQGSMNITPTRVELIGQFYITTGDVEVRLRKVTCGGYIKYYETVKIKTDDPTVRKEIEGEIAAELYYRFWHDLGITPINKQRVYFEYEGKEMCIDIYLQLGIAVMEVEFESTRESDEFILPDFVDREVTGDSTYKAQNLWKKVNKGAALCK